MEILNKDGKDSGKDWDEFDPEQFFGSTQVNTNKILIFNNRTLDKFG